MFDIGFSELVLIGIVALVVFGPEELPRIARTAGHMLGRLRRYVSDVKADISREMEAADLKNVVSEVQESARALQGSLNEQAASLKAEFAGISSLPAEIDSTLRESLQTPVAEPVSAPSPVQAALPEAGPEGEAATPEPAQASAAPALPEPVAPDHFAPPAETPAETASPAGKEPGVEARVEEAQLDLFGAPLPPLENRKE